MVIVTKGYHFSSHSAKLVISFKIMKLFTHFSLKDTDY